MTILAESAPAEKKCAHSRFSSVTRAYCLSLAASLYVFAQEPPAPLPTPPITGPLRAQPPIDLGGGIAANGVLSGIGLWQGNPLPGDETRRGDLSNGQAWVQKANGWWQFYVQAGAYNLPALGAAFLPTDKTLSEFYGPAPVAYVKIAPSKNTSIQAGSLFSLIGMESTFTFQNMNVNRGLLWGQENAITRGVQLNQTIGNLSASFSWNDGFYSNRYSVLSGSLTYAAGPHSVSFQAMGNLSQTAFRSLATPVQNNATMYLVTYVYSKGGWIVQPYAHFADIPENPRADIAGTPRINGGAVLVSRSLRRGWSIAGRAEYLSTSGTLNVLYGPGSAAWSATVTPTYQISRVFVRGDLAVVRAMDETPGLAFGPAGNAKTQPRATIEAGFLF